MSAGVRAAVPPILRVIFRTDIVGEVTAVLPDLPANPGRFMIYAHLEQHSEATRGWYRTTRPARAFEYATLLEELQQIYCEYTLDIGQRLPNTVGT